MAWYNYELAKHAVLGFCYSHVPKTPIQIARHLKSKVKGFYPKTPDKKAVGFLRRDVLLPLTNQSLLVRFIQGDREAWAGARTLVVNNARASSLPVPRGVKELYQTHFLFGPKNNKTPTKQVVENNKTPTILALPNIKPEQNLRLFLLLHRFSRPPLLAWNVFNVLLCAASPRGRDQLRLFLYTLPLDYRDIELLEELLEYGIDYENLSFPLQPDIEQAKSFFNELVYNK